MSVALPRQVKGAGWVLDQVQPEDVFTPEDLSDDQKMIAQMTRDFVQRDVLPVREEIEHQRFEHHRRLMRKAGELGLLCAEIPEEYGGLDLDKVSATLITENLASAGSWALTHGAHVGIGTLPIVFFGTPEQKQKYLPKLATGEWIAAYCLTEAGSGSDALAARTTARLSPDGKHYVLNGTKQWITNGGLADVFVVYAKIDGEKFTAFIVERAFPGVSLGAEEKKMGIKGSSTVSVILEDVKVPAENLLGEIGRGHVIAFNILNIGRYKLGAGVTGSSKALIDIAARYARERRQFGRSIADFRLIQQKLADMAVRTFASESAVFRTAGLIDAGLAPLRDGGGAADPKAAARAIEEYAIECSINKVFGSETLDFVVDEAVQIHGGYGYMQEYAVERAYRDARINRIFEGTNEINRLLLTGTLLKRAMKGELPLMEAAANLPAELTRLAQGGSEGPLVVGDGPLAAKLGMAQVAKKILLMVAGLGVQKHQMAIEQEQELLAAVADVAIDVFAMESALARAAKTAARGGENAEHQARMAKLFAREAFDRIAGLACAHLPSLLEGEALAAQLKLLHRLTLYPAVDRIGLKREIAARVLQAEGYVA